VRRRPLDLPFGGVRPDAGRRGGLLTGGFQLIKAVKGDFLKHLDPQARGRSG
jgi:hypothetical protein